MDRHGAFWNLTKEDAMTLGQIGRREASIFVAKCQMDITFNILGDIYKFRRLMGKFI